MEALTVGKSPLLQSVGADPNAVSDDQIRAAGAANGQFQRGMARIIMAIPRQLGRAGAARRGTGPSTEFSGCSRNCNEPASYAQKLVTE
jgi:hypothetical protein